MTNTIRTRREANGTWSYLLFGDWVATDFQTSIGAETEGAGQYLAHRRFLRKSRGATYLDMRHA